eukprot:ANDGO_03850.mRNA.1 hypothetical protein
MSDVAIAPRQGSSPEAKKEAFENAKKPYRPRVACVDFFDRLWFCYTPGHQLTQLYRYGQIDTCQESLSTMWECMKLKVFPDETRETRILGTLKHKNPSGAEHFWDIREPQPKDTPS